MKELNDLANYVVSPWTLLVSLLTLCIAPYAVLWVVVRCWPKGHPNRAAYLGDYRGTNDETPPIEVWRRPKFVADAVIHSLTDGLEARYVARVARIARERSDGEPDEDGGRARTKRPRGPRPVAPPNVTPHRAARNDDNDHTFVLDPNAPTVPTLNIVDTVPTANSVAATDLFVNGPMYQISRLEHPTTTCTSTTTAPHTSTTTIATSYNDVTIPTIYARRLPPPPTGAITANVSCVFEKLQAPSCAIAPEDKDLP